MEDDLTHPPRMLLKFDIEKACDTLSWTVILATFSKMQFSGQWISWIHAYISFATFSFFY